MGAEEEDAAEEPIIGPPPPPPPPAAAADADSSDADEYEEGAQQHSSVCSTTVSCFVGVSLIAQPSLQQDHVHTRRPVYLTAVIGAAFSRCLAMLFADL
jgi:hypothetical protein